MTDIRVKIPLHRYVVRSGDECGDDGGNYRDTLVFCRVEKIHGIPFFDKNLTLYNNTKFPETEEE